MILLLHVVAALSSLAISGYAVFRPTNNALRASYALVGATLASGTVLVLSLRVSLASVCLSGLLYLSAVTASLLLAHRRLAKVTVKK